MKALSDAAFWLVFMVAMATMAPVFWLASRILPRQIAGFVAVAGAFGLQYATGPWFGGDGRRGDHWTIPFGIAGFFMIGWGFTDNPPAQR